MKASIITALILLSLDLYSYTNSNFYTEIIKLQVPFLWTTFVFVFLALFVGWLLDYLFFSSSSVIEF